MDVTLLGMTTEVNELLLLNAYVPMVFKESGNVTVSTLLPLERKYAGILVTLSPNVSDEMVEGNTGLLEDELKSEQLVALNVKAVRAVQPLNAELPMDVTLLSMVTEVKPLQPEKA